MAAGMGTPPGLPPMPPEELAALQALLTGGAPGAAPMSPDAVGMAPPVDPAAVVAADPNVPAGAAPIPGMPSTDPQLIAEAAAQLQAADTANLQSAQAAAMQTAASMMGGPVAAPGAPPLGGDPFGGPVPGQVPMGDPTLGGDPNAMPPELMAALGPAGIGGLEGENVATLAPGDFSSELGAY